MHTRFEVRSRSGDLLGIFPGPIEDHADQVSALMAERPGADVRPVVTLDNPCEGHPAYEADNCPGCGTASIL
ncbi:hypothetical protein GCM10027026_31640 [Myroides odoratimimus subsp. xuanwuensis]